MQMALAPKLSSVAPKTVSFFSIVAEYAERMLPPDNTMKVLLLDEQTLGIISLSFSQTALLKKGVFLVDRIEHSGQRNVMKSMRCIMLIRPQPSSISAACEELRAAKYESYSIVFSCAAQPEVLDQLARADTEGLVNQVEEMFCDFNAINNDTVLITSPLCPLVPSLMSHAQFVRIAEGLASMFVALRRQPHVRFQKNSDFARRVAMELCGILSKDPDLYNYKSRDTVLLIVDRKDDPLTPILTPWTYQAMLHDLVTLTNNRLVLPETANEEDGYVFSQHDDAFFAANMYANWGDLCTNVKTYVDKCKGSLNIDRSTATMEEIKQFMQKLPQTKSLTGSVTKHATVVSHLLSVIKRRQLLDVSLLEQDMVSSSNQQEHWNRLSELAQRKIEFFDLVRLCLIYSLRYEKPGQASRAQSLLQNAQSLDTSRVGAFGAYTSGTMILRKLRDYYGDRPTDPMFGATGVMASIVKTFSDVSNVYTQHEPVLKRTLLQLFLGKLDQEQFPYVSPTTTQAFKPTEVITYMCGGFTFAEAALVNAVNSGTAFTGSVASAVPSGVRAYLGGTAALNNRAFLDQLNTLP